MPFVHMTKRSLSTDLPTSFYPCQLLNNLQGISIFETLFRRRGIVFERCQPDSFIEFHKSGQHLSKTIPHIPKRVAELRDFVIRVSTKVLPTALFDQLVLSFATWQLE